MRDITKYPNIILNEQIQIETQIAVVLLFFLHLLFIIFILGNPIETSGVQQNSHGIQQKN